MRYQAVLFDFDGTLFDTWPGLAAAYQATHRHLFHSEWNSQPARSVLLMLRASVLHNMLERTPSREEEHFFVRTYQTLMLTKSPPFPGVFETLAWLNERGIPWGIASNKPYEHTKKFVDHIPLLQTVQCVVCANDILPHNPAPICCSQLAKNQAPP